MAGQRAGPLKLLLDTTYILPSLGVEVEGVEPALEALKRLRGAGAVELYYSPFSLLEAVAKASRLPVPSSAVEAGLLAVTTGYREASPTVEAWMLALELRRAGLRDVIDAVLYSTAEALRLRLLTRDRALIEFLRRHGYPLNPVMEEDELLAAAGEGSGRD